MNDNVISLNGKKFEDSQINELSFEAYEKWMQEDLAMLKAHMQANGLTQVQVYLVTRLPEANGGLGVSRFGLGDIVVQLGMLEMAKTLACAEGV